MGPGVAFLEVLIVAAEELDVVEGDLPLARVELAVVFAAGDVDDIARLALFKGLPRIGEGLGLGAVSAIRTRANEPFAGAGGRGRRERDDRQEEERDVASPHGNLL